ncbi:cytochrome P450 [Natronosalvus rutilus]|uniref:Cytochrome P450 n=1 Tax=Natronosalvus rutilus TaxID=2953753 RepID=A0A9E7NBY9_9EURY|nr:cytochrome P450 [Natronosalvus rutilus]UTF54093.1 cytochrome P450 [Natronosalvus rutilus]
MSDLSTPPTPDGGALLGHTRAFSRDPFGALERWADHGDVVRLEFPGETFYLVSDPALIERVLHDADGRFVIAEQQRRAFADVEDHAVTTAVGDRWRRLRTALQPAFARNTIDRYADGMVEQTVSRVEAWDDGEEIDLHREMRYLTLDILAETLLGVDIGGNEDVVLDATDALVDRADPRRPAQLLPDWVPTPTDRRFRRKVAALDSYVDRCLAARQEGSRGDDACSVLLDAHDRGELTGEEVRHNLVALLLAGSDTSALGLTYCWYLLSTHPDAYSALVAEYDEHVESKRPTAESRERLDGLRNAVSETLRLYPPTWNTMRQAVRPVMLGGYRLPEGAELMLSQWVLHRDERFWESPSAFRPSRWEDERDRPEYAYFPFSGGPRHCIGMHFAWLELHLALATMIGRVELDVTIDETLTFAPTLSLRPEAEISAIVRHR